MTGASVFMCIWQCLLWTLALSIYMSDVYVRWQLLIPIAHLSSHNGGIILLLKFVQALRDVASDHVQRSK